MAAAEKFEHVSNPVARDEREARAERGYSDLPVRQNILRGMADAGQVVPPAVQEEFLLTGRFNKDWIREATARFTRTELEEERRLNDRLIAASRILALSAERHRRQQAGNVANRDTRGKRAGKPAKRLDAAKALVEAGATYEAAAQEVGYKAGGDALRKALGRVGFVGPRARKR